MRLPDLVRRPLSRGQRHKPEGWLLRPPGHLRAPPGRKIGCASCVPTQLVSDLSESMCSSRGPSTECSSRGPFKATEIRTSGFPSSSCAVCTCVRPQSGGRPRVSWSRIVDQKRFRQEGGLLANFHFDSFLDPIRVGPPRVTRPPRHTRCISTRIGCVGGVGLPGVHQLRPELGWCRPQFGVPVQLSAFRDQSAVSGLLRAESALIWGRLGQFGPVSPKFGRNELGHLWPMLKIFEPTRANLGWPRPLSLRFQQDAGRFDCLFAAFCPIGVALAQVWTSAARGRQRLSPSSGCVGISTLR